MTGWRQEEGGACLREEGVVSWTDMWGLQRVREPDGLCGGQQMGKLRKGTGLWLCAGPVHPEVLGASSRQGHRAHSEGFIPPSGAFGRLVRDQEKHQTLESQLVEVKMGKQADGKASCDGEADPGVRV